MATSSFGNILNSTISEETWVLQTRKKLENATPVDENTPISICHVPKFISVINPQAYAPQVIALGPYHYLRPELRHMERYKIETVKWYWTPYEISLVVKKLQEIVPKVRACYHNLDVEDDTLALILAIDGLFLIYLLSKHLNRFTDDASVFRDVMMLENQIPITVLKEIGTTIGSSDAALFSTMRVFCQSQSPFALSSDHQQVFQESKVVHLLDLLHEMITMHQIIKQPASAPQEAIQLSRQESIMVETESDNDQLIENTIEILTREAVSSIKPVKLITSLPWGMISNLLSHGSGVKEVATKNPLVQEIDIPSVSKLSKLAGIKFQPETGGNLEIRLDSPAATLYLPVITLNGNSEVILRNLVAYEMASRSCNSGYHNLVLAQYVDLMSGIIDTKEDASLLQRAGIIKGDLSNSHVADLFNGMNKSSQKVYNETAAKINEYYRQKPKVKVYMFVKRYFYESWKVLTIVSTMVLLLLMILQSVCSVYDCKGVIKIIDYN